MYFLFCMFFLTAISIYQIAELWQRCVNAHTREAKDPAGLVGDSARKSDAQSGQSDASLCFDNVSFFACNRRDLSLRSLILLC